MASEASPQIVPDERTQFAVLLFTDICDSTALKARHGAMDYKKVAELHNRLFEELAAEEKLTLIKNTGDGYFARSTSVAAVVRFALRFQHLMRAMDWPGFPITTRVGIHAGEVADITTLGQADVLAPAADLVARVMGLAVGGQILLTRGPFDEARHFVRAHPQVESGEVPGLTWLAHGPYLFKGCEEPVEVFEVGAAQDAPLTAPPDGEKAKRVLRPGEEETLGWRPAGGLEVPGRAEWALVRKLGEGGFGEVWLARHRTLKDERVFKFCFDADKVRSLKREVTLFRVLRDRIGSSAGIVAVHDVFFDAPPYFIVMDFIDGPDLAGWAVAHEPLGSVPLETRLEIVAQVADALQSAHDAGVIHRDVKPSNILIEEKDGHPRARLADFGIGQLVSGDTPAGITQIGFTQTIVNEDSLTGTHLYLAPEMLAGQPATIRSDIYALGVMLYQLALGALNRPLTSDWGEDIADLLLREDIQHCVAGDPAKRFAGGAQISAHLRALPQRRAEKEAAERLRARSARRKKQVRLVSFAAVAVVIVALFLAFAFFRERGLKQKIAEEGHRAKANEQRANDTLGELRATAPTFHQQAKVLTEQNKLPEALEKIGIALTLNSGDSSFVAQRGNILQSMERFTEAADAYAAALSLNPEEPNAAANFELSRLLATKKPKDGVLSTDARMKWRDALSQQGRHAEAILAGSSLTADPAAMLSSWQAKIDGWLGKDAPRIKVQTINGLYDLDVRERSISDLSPLRGMPLGALNIMRVPHLKDLGPLKDSPISKLYANDAYDLTDLSPLRGKEKLDILYIAGTSVSNLEDLATLPNLHVLYCGHTQISDLTPIRNAHLESLEITLTPVESLAPIKGQPLKLLVISGTRITDLSPLLGAKLKFFEASECKITSLAALTGMPLQHVSISRVHFESLEPLAGAPLEELEIEGCGHVDLTPLKGKKLRIFAAADGTTLEHMEVLAEMDTLEIVTFTKGANDPGILRKLPRLRKLDTVGWYAKRGDLNKIKDAAIFWKEYDAQQAEGKK